jgi:ATP-binding cassette subfamily B protein
MAMGGFGGPGMHMGGLGGMRGNLTDEEKKNRPKITKAMAKRIFSYLKPYWPQFIVVFIAIALESALGLVPSLLTKQIVDTALPNKDINLLVVLIAFSFGATVILSLTGVLDNYVNTWIGQHIIYDMKNQMYDHLQHMAHRFFTTERQGEAITRMTSDIGGVQGVISGTLTSVTSNVLTISATLIALFSMSWQLAILGIIVVPLFIIPTKRVGRTRWKILLKS